MEVSGKFTVTGFSVSPSNSLSSHKQFFNVEVSGIFREIRGSDPVTLSMIIEGERCAEVFKAIERLFSENFKPDPR